MRQAPPSPRTGWIFDLRSLRGPVLVVDHPDAETARASMLAYLIEAGSGDAEAAEAMLDEIDVEITPTAVLVP